MEDCQLEPMNRDELGDEWSKVESINLSTKLKTMRMISIGNQLDERAQK